MKFGFFSLLSWFLQVVNTGVKVWSRNNDGEEFGCAFRLAQEVKPISVGAPHLKIFYSGKKKKVVDRKVEGTVGPHCPSTAKVK